MTGFGRAEQAVSEKNFLVEIKALNGKQFELQLKLPPLLKPFEFNIRNLLQEQLIRGSVDCYINIKQNGSTKPVIINTELIKAYYNQINELAAELNMDTSAVLSSLLRLPEVVSPANDVMSEDEYKKFEDVLKIAIGQLNTHRVEEGISLQKDLRNK